MKLVSSSLVSTSTPRSSSVWVQVPLETGAFCCTQLPPSLFHTCSSCWSLKKAQFRWGNPVLLRCTQTFTSITLIGSKYNTYLNRNCKHSVIIPNPFWKGECYFYRALKNKYLKGKIGVYVRIFHCITFKDQRIQISNFTPIILSGLLPFLFCNHDLFFFTNLHL